MRKTKIVCTLGPASDTKEMIENVFQFDNLSVADVMIRRSDMSVIYENGEPLAGLDVNEKQEIQICKD